MANRNFTVVQEGASRSFSISTGVGPAGPTGAGGGVESWAEIEALPDFPAEIENLSGTNSGDQNLSGYALKITPSDLAGGTTLAVNGIYFDTFSANRTLTFSGTPTNGDTILLTFDCSAEIILTIPTSYRVGDTGTTTGITFPAGNHIIKWSRMDARWYVADTAWETAADETAPSLSAVSASAGNTTGSLAATSNENGTMYWFVSASATPPTAANLKTGTGAVYSANEACTATVSTTQTATGLTNGTAYYLHVLAADAAGNDSSISTTTSFTPVAVDSTPPTLSSATIAANGTTLTLVFSEVMNISSGGAGGVNVDASTGGANVTCTYASGTATDTLIFTLGTTILSGETCDLDYTQPGSGLEDIAGNDLASIVSASVTNNSTQTSDTTAPILSSVSGTQTGDTTATLAATTDEGNGTLYWFVSASATPPTAANLKTGTGAVFASSEAISTTGAKTEPATGLTAATAYYLHALHRDAAGNDSSIATSSSFTTAAAPGPLLTNLVAWYDLTGDLVDAHTSGHDLSSPSGYEVAAAVGPFSDTGGSIEADVDSYAGIVHSDFEFTTSFSLAFWVTETAAASAAGYLVNRAGETTSDRAWRVGYANSGSTDDIVVGLYNGVTTLHEANVVSDIPETTWVHIVVAYDAAAQTIKGYRNNVLKTTRTSANGVPTSLPAQTGKPFSLFRRSNNGTAVNATTYVTGSVRLARLGVWNRALDTTDIADLYNSGADVKYADL